MNLKVLKAFLVLWFGIGVCFFFAYEPDEPLGVINVTLLTLFLIASIIVWLNTDEDQITNNKNKDK